MTTITRAAFLADPVAALKLSETQHVHVLDEDGVRRMVLSSPRIDADCGCGVLAAEIEACRECDPGKVKR